MCQSGHTLVFNSHHSGIYISCLNKLQWIAFISLMRLCNLFDIFLVNMRSSGNRCTAFAFILAFFLKVMHLYCEEGEDDIDANKRNTSATNTACESLQKIIETESGTF